MVIVIVGFTTSRITWLGYVRLIEYVLPRTSSSISVYLQAGSPEDSATFPLNRHHTCFTPRAKGPFPLKAKWIPAKPWRFAVSPRLD